MMAARAEPASARMVSSVNAARETQEMVFDALDRAFAFFKGACTRGIYDSIDTAHASPIIILGKGLFFQEGHK
jgi:hypothetical protein